MLTDRSRKARTLCSSLAIATALVVGGGAVRAQSFQGSGSVEAGSANINNTSPGQTTVTVNGNAVIRWTPTDTATGGGAINFQPAGTTALFQSGTDFKVLNRIIPTDASRPVVFNGTVRSQIGFSAAAPGGTVYFYSPGGIILGSTAVFDVGNLGLTTASPIFDPQTGAFDTNNTVVFSQANPNTEVRIDPGASITARSNYAAVVAPVVTHAGTMNVAANAALVSADAATVTFSPDGLFDIQVTSGTSATLFSIENKGTITGPAFSGQGPAHRIYMVAVPKNDAITFAIERGSRLGFDVAGAANVVGNAVVLSAGHNITKGEIEAAPAGGTGRAFLTINDSNINGTAPGIDFTSAVKARSSGSLDLQVYRQTAFASDALLEGSIYSQALVVGFSGATPPTPGSLTVGGNLTISADRSLARVGDTVDAGNAIFDISNGSTASIGGTMQVSASAFADSTGDGIATAGIAQIRTSQSSNLAVSGDLVLRGTANGGSALAAAGSGNLQMILDTGSSVNVGGATRLLASGTGAAGRNGAGGGFAGLTVRGGAALSTDRLNIMADGRGGNDAGAGAGDGTGGTAGIFVSGANSRVTVANPNTAGQNIADRALLSAFGFGGVSNGGGSGVGGAGTGGNATINVTAGATFTGPTTTNSDGFVGILARGIAGNANTGAIAGGQARGGTINILVDNATMTSANLLPSAFSQGGFATTTATGNINGGNAVGGTRNITVSNNGTLTTQFNGGTAGAQGGDGLGTGRGGNASGGSALLTVDTGATVNLTGSSSVFTTNGAGDGGAQGAGGSATGGNATVNVLNGAKLNMVGPATNTFTIAANSAESTVANNSSLIGSSATGGIARFLVNNGTVNLQTVEIDASGAGGSRLVSQGGIGAGGSAVLQLSGATFKADSLRIDAEGLGGSLDAGQSGVAGDGRGGTARIAAFGGNNTLTAQFIEITGQGEGGDIGGASGTTSGSGFGGLAEIAITGGANLTLNVPEIGLVADGEGGQAIGATDVGGNGTAGTARTFVNGGNLTVNGSLSLEADSAGGDGTVGGNGVLRATGGPNAILQAQNGSITVTGATVLSSEGDGGNGSGAGNGGNAAGGWVQLLASNGNGSTGRGSINLSSVEMHADASGGSAAGSGNGGLARNGESEFIANGGSIALSGSATFNAYAVGGNGLNGGAAIANRPVDNPRALIFAANGSVTVAGAVEMYTSAVGGNATSGAGQGGLAYAGEGGIDTVNQAAGPAIVTVGSLLVDANAFGGAGGAGIGSQSGGAGGEAYGGGAFVYGRAGNGQVTITGDTNIGVSGTGGAGGAGGSGGSTAPGAAGGAGGRAFGGGLTVGTASGSSTTTNDGFARFANIVGTASAIGGAGGAGGSGTTQGAGGEGGDAYGGSAGVLVRGSPVSADTVTLIADGQGGAGGAGSPAGAGGDGAAGNANLIVTQRFQRTERGSLTANVVSLSTTGTGGSGSVQGVSYYSDAAGGSTATPGFESQLYLRQSDVNIGSLTIVNAGATAPNFTITALSDIDPATGMAYADGIPRPQPLTVAADPFDITLLSATATFGSLSVTTPGEMRMNLDGSVLNAGNLTLSAANFVLPAAPLVAPGQINVTGTFNLSTALNFLAYANFNLGSAFSYNAPGAFRMGNLTSPGSVTVLAQGALTLGDVTAAGVDLRSFVNPVTLGNIVSTGSGSVLLRGSPVAAGSITSGGAIDITSGSGIALGALQAATSINLGVNGPLSIGNVQAGGAFSAGAQQSISAGSISAAGISLMTNGALTAGKLASTLGVNLGALGNITVGSVQSRDLTKIRSSGNIQAGDITSGASVDANATGSNTLGNISAGIVNPVASGSTYAIGIGSGASSLTAGNLLARGQVVTGGATTVSVGSVSGADYLALAGTGLTTGPIVTGTYNASTGTYALGGRTYLVSATEAALGGPLDSFNTAPIFAAAPVAITGPITVNGGISTGTLQAHSTQALSITGNTVAQGAAVLVGGGTTSAGNIDVGDTALVVGAAGVTVGNVTAGVSSALPVGANAKVAIGSGSGSVTTGNLTALRDLGVQAAGSITTGALRGRDVLLLAGGSVSTGSVLAVTGTQPLGRVFIGNFSMATSTVNVFQPFTGTAVNTFLNTADATRVGGSITLASVVAGDVNAAAAQNFTAGAITAGTATQTREIDLNIGGTATVNGAWRGTFIDVLSGDIVIASNGSIDGLSSQGEVALLSNNTAGMTVGDGLSGTGYNLSNEEFSRVKAGHLIVAAVDYPSVSTDLTIGNLTIDGAQLYGANGYITFAAGNLDTETPSGTVRIAGDIAANGFAATNEIEILADLVELDAAKGSLKVSDSSGKLGGIVTIEADRIHVASDDILTKLRADPKYPGYVAELNAPAVVQRPEGVLRAAVVDLEGNKSILIQNTGTRQTPAGVFAGFDPNSSGEGTNIGGEDTTPGGLDIVFNGQLQRPDGTILTGRQAFEAAVAAAKADLDAGEVFGADLFTTSTFNGCTILTGTCAGSADPVAALSSEIALVTNATIDDSPTAPAADDADEGEDGSSDDQEDEDSGDDEGSSPIAPPVPLISTRALDGVVDVTEPVSGAGNPALIGSAVDEATAAASTTNGDDQ